MNCNELLSLLGEPVNSMIVAKDLKSKTRGFGEFLLFFLGTSTSFILYARRTLYKPVPTTTNFLNLYNFNIDHPVNQFTKAFSLSGSID